MINLSRPQWIVLGIVVLVVVMLLGILIGMAVARPQAAALIEAPGTQVSEAGKTVTAQAATGTAAAATIGELSNQVSNINKTVTAQAKDNARLSEQVSNAGATATTQAKANATATAISNEREFVWNCTILIEPNKFATIPGIELSGKSFTIAAWVKRESENQNFFAIGHGKERSPNKALHFGYKNDNSFSCGFSDNDRDTDPVHTDTDWHHWACTVDTAQDCSETAPCRIIYQDGKKVKSGRIGSYSGHYKGSGDLWIGNALASTTTNGSVAGVAVYHRVLSEEEIQSLMEDTNPQRGVQ
jgi:hypothetical protein